MLKFTAITQIMKGKKKKSVKRTVESLGHRPICITTERVKGPLNHVQTEIWAAHVRSIQMCATHTHTRTTARTIVMNTEYQRRPVTSASFSRGADIALRRAKSPVTTYTTVTVT